MERYSIAERQAIKDRLADEKYFDRDRALFASLFPHHALLPELARANNVNRLSLCRRMIYNLLTKVSEADIVAVRSGRILRERFAKFGEILYRISLV